MDNIFLTGPLGTQWNIGSWLEKAAAAVDYGAAGLLRQQLSQNAWVEGARFGFETAAGPRRMSFPLLVPSGGVGGLSLDAIEASLRQMVRPGGFLDIKPDGVPTGEMVRFDVLGGDVAHRDYSIDLQRIGRRRYTLGLQTQPFGYWPTWITLASGASWAFGAVPVPVASMVGDMPGYAQLVLQATQASSAGRPFADGLVWAIGGPSQFQPVATIAIDTFDTRIVGSIVSTGADTRLWSGGYVQLSTPSSNNFGLIGRAYIGATIEPRYRGRFRVFTQAAPAAPVQFVVDVAGDAAGFADVGPMASAQPIASVSPSFTSLTGGYNAVELGEVSLPMMASGASQGVTLRLWAKNPASNNANVYINRALFLVPVDGPAGFLSRGLAVANEFGFGMNRLVIDSSIREMFGAAAAADLSAQQMGQQSLAQYHFGGFPFVGATAPNLTLLVLSRASWSFIGTNPPINTIGVGGTGNFTAYSLRYRPRFQFLKGI